MLVCNNKKPFNFLKYKVFESTLNIAVGFMSPLNKDARVATTLSHGKGLNIANTFFIIK